MSHSAKRNAEDSPGIRMMTLAKRFMYWIALLLVVAISYLYYREPLPRPTERLARIQTLQAQKKVLAADSARLSRRIEWLKDESDPSYLVIEAREKLGLQHEDEIIVRLE
jgi:cell division protein FtsB